MTAFSFAERPVGLTGPAARTPINERGGAHSASDASANLAVRGDGTARRVGSRPHQNEPPHRPPVPGGNTKSAGGRVASPNRPTMPAQARRGGDAPVTEASTTETAVLPAVTDTSGGSTGFPSRPDPSDPATEVWALVERAQAGEAEAFGLIYDRYVDTVFRFVYFRVGNRQLAEDLTSDTFLRALKRIGSFTWQGRDLGAWLVTIARNLVADHFKSGRYRLEVTTGDVLDADREDRGPEGSPEAAVVEHITNVALLSAVKRLNPEQQECIVLRFLQGFSVAETARAMGKNEGAIKALQYRAVRALARLLPDGFQP
ncbi:ECF subfamily RNA polymerase sigma factor, BldN family [Micromonospora sp. DT48]|uniref:ECF subfamily RNA polymerase sigma factor, BldN family n=1 Tax=unclassified Micromonospora TaxID=2617518 RepID=UPI0012BC5FBF|nr:ECF subfamily RNA polymerase sigma factor, BldN family [Micromonospora sp. CP22]MTK00682.1 sigma-70 family RNA polymerase sigma factor [Micromonospora sp. CP22]